MENEKVDKSQKKSPNYFLILRCIIKSRIIMQDLKLFFLNRLSGRSVSKCISLDRLLVPSPKRVTNLPWTYKKLHCKVKHIGTVFSEIHRYKHNTFCYFYMFDSMIICIFLDFSCFRAAL